MLGIFTFGNPIHVSVPGCPLGFFCESGDPAVRLHPKFAIGREIAAQFMTFLNKLFQLGIHPGISLLQTALVATASDSALYGRLQKASTRFSGDATDDTVYILLLRHLWKRGQSAYGYLGRLLLRTHSSLMSLTQISNNGMWSEPSS